MHPCVEIISSYPSHRMHIITTWFRLAYVSDDLREGDTKAVDIALQRQTTSCNIYWIQIFPIGLRSTQDLRQRCSKEKPKHHANHALANNGIAMMSYIVPIHATL